MDQIETLQNDITKYRNECKTLYQQLGFANESIRALVELLETTEHATAPALVTAKRYLSEQT